MTCEKSHGYINISKVRLPGPKARQPFFCVQGLPVPAEKESRKNRFPGYPRPFHHTAISDGSTRSAS